MCVSSKSSHTRLKNLNLYDYHREVLALVQDGGVSSLDLAAKFGIGHNESVGKPTALSVDEGHLYSSFFSPGMWMRGSTRSVV